MALFFDQAWFDARLAERHLGKGDLGAVLGLDERAVAEIWKDQRELKADDVTVISALLNLPPAEIASRAGISTPVPGQTVARKGDDLAARLAAIEAKLDEILRRLG